jgi:hypothetical protein
MTVGDGTIWVLKSTRPRVVVAHPIEPLKVTTPLPGFVVVNANSRITTFAFDTGFVMRRQPTDCASAQDGWV